MVRLAVPELVRVRVCALLLPTFTVPKARLLGLAESRSVAPVPESDTVAGELVALLTTEMLPVALPAAAGVKAAPNEVLWPGVRVKGRDNPVMLKPSPAVVA